MMLYLFVVEFLHGVLFIVRAAALKKVLGPGRDVGQLESHRAVIYAELGMVAN